VAALRGLLGEADPAVVGAAAEAAGKAGHLELLLDIAGMLPDRRRRSAAREALVAYGHRGAGALGDLLVDPEHDPAVRREIPWVLGRIATPRSADILVEQLGTTDPILKYRVVKALNRMHEHHPELPAARSDIARQIQSQTRSYYEALVLWQALQPGANGTRLLVRALRERLDQHLELIFRLLGLQYPQKDIYSAYTALQGERADRRGAAIEFLDTLLRSDLKTLILPLVEESSAERLIERAVAAFGIEAKQPDEALRIILEAGDTWLRACALHEIGDRRLRELRGLVEPLAEDREPLLRETAQWALERCA
jgi:AAA family ATP:ADP antiporter